MMLGLIERSSAKGYDFKIKKLKSLPVLSYFSFCNVLYIWVCPGHPYFSLIESTDSIIKVHIVNYSHITNINIVKNTSATRTQPYPSCCQLYVQYKCKGARLIYICAQRWQYKYTCNVIIIVILFNLTKIVSACTKYYNIHVIYILVIV